MMDIYNNNQGIAFGVTATNHSNQMVANTIMKMMVKGLISSRYKYFYLS